jgi:alpha-galactosidase
LSEHIVLIGAGSAMFTRGLIADLLRWGQEVDLVLVDIDPDALEVAEGLARKMVALAGAPITVRADVDRRQVLPGATAVICTVGVGGRRAWEQDVFIPRQYGIYQPVGDTVGPGGTSRALRMIPAMVAIAEDVVDLAPEALFFNYGNPMAPVCRAVRRATGAPVVGLCHGVNDVAAYLAEALGVAPARLSYTAAGLNHLTWFTEVRVDGRDAMPRLLEIAHVRATDALEEHAVDDAQRHSPFSWRLCALFGAFPAVLDRHVVEFFPQFFAEGDYYGATLGIGAYSFEHTIARGDEIYDAMRYDALSARPLPGDYLERIGGEHEQVVEIIDSIRRNAGRVYSMNLPNRGQVPNLPPEAVIESPAVAGRADNRVGVAAIAQPEAGARSRSAAKGRVVPNALFADASGLHAIGLPPLAAGIAGTLAGRIGWVETVVEAALEGSRDKVIQALVIDGAVSSLDVAERLAHELIEAQAEYLPQFGL